ncbi:hypothetical protein, variant 5 [Aphanomyces invadans]|uniref:Uncharacterized protein n=1 Tax=Aphanomyces invadans TaxID=157072 RepID=A0A024UTV6_9STRA|nr:hypothetical protein, variant 5 [Aphanomyces invadans]XP_008863164.1 hypothetical protein, variant 4 [Aphanomyces invadans]ETW09357.1 hypothetical protein, variant 4 [Aphanomyces invadans]ETW09358.1 hypothetical protein, variant 5 [Aphanomyces invadans]|eukprot:XP_008863159.1 hypothetical protein, variant 5 [Aphanomyces invadans]
MDSEHFALLDRHGRHIPRLLRPRPRWFSPKHRTESQRGIFDANQTHHSTNLDAFPTAAFRTDVLATVTSFEVPSSQHVVRIAMHDLDGAMLPPSVPRRPVPPAIFDANVIYGMFSASPYDILRRHSRLDEDRLNRMYSALRLLGSPLLLNSDGPNVDGTWLSRGVSVGRAGPRHGGAPSGCTSKDHGAGPCVEMDVARVGHVGDPSSQRDPRSRAHVCAARVPPREASVL